jgi:hypothetical protein
MQIESRRDDTNGEFSRKLFSPWIFLHHARFRRGKNNRLWHGRRRTATRDEWPILLMRDCSPGMAWKPKPLAAPPSSPVDTPAQPAL